MIGTEIVHSRGGFGFNGHIFDKIVRETPTQWVSELGYRYKKDGLVRIGDYGTLTVKTEDHVNRNRVYELQSNIDSKLYDLSMVRNRIKITSVKDLERIEKIVCALADEMLSKKEIEQ